MEKIRFILFKNLYKNSLKIQFKKKNWESLNSVLELQTLLQCTNHIRLHSRTHAQRNTLKNPHLNMQKVHTHTHFRNTPTSAAKSRTSVAKYSNEPIGRETIQYNITGGESEKRTTCLSAGGRIFPLFYFGFFFICFRVRRHFAFLVLHRSARPWNPPFSEKRARKRETEATFFCEMSVCVFAFVDLCFFNFSNCVCNWQKNGVISARGNLKIRLKRIIARRFEESSIHFFHDRFFFLNKQIKILI